MGATLVPTVQWAQRKDKLYVTIDLQDAKEPQIKLENEENAHHGKMHFRAQARSHATGPEKHEYAVDLDLYGEIDPEASKISVKDRSVLLVISKKGPMEHWPRLLKDSGKPHANIKVDWDKWVDEDEEDETQEKFDLGDLQNFSSFEGLGGSGAALGDDSDDDDLPDLESAEAPVV